MVSSNPDMRRSTSLTPQIIALRLLAWLEKHDIPNCLLGDTRRFPTEIRSDLDLVVPQSALPLLPRALGRFCDGEGIHLVQVFQHEITACYYTLAWFDEDGSPAFLNPDVCGHFVRIGRFYLNADELLAGRKRMAADSERSDTFHIAAPAVNFIYYLIKKVDKQDISPESGEFLSELWTQDPEKAGGHIRRFWPEAEARMLIDAARSNHWEPVRTAVTGLRTALRKARPFSPATAVLEMVRKVRRAVCPTGLMVALLGPDGCGKSSVIDRASVALSPAFRRTTTLHLRPHLGRKSAQTDAAAVQNPHGQTPYGRVLATVKIFYLLFDYAAGYACSIYGRLARSTLVLFDRYYHDVLVDPRRYRFQRAGGFARLIGKLVPQPDLWIVLDAPVEVLRKRKQEVSAEETARQRKAYMQLASQLRNVVVIDASKQLEVVVSEVNASVLSTMAGRMARRLRLGE
jgi:thymidylate kinase